MVLRAALLGLAVALAPAFGGATEPPPRAVTEARFADPTDRYRHNVLGDLPAYGTLVLKVDRCHACARADIVERRLVLPPELVFEDVAPRLVDLAGYGQPHVIVVEAHVSKGARLAVYDDEGRVAATPFIGRAHRWLAPAGAADLDGDGRMEIAFVDRPHLARVLRVWRWERWGELTEVAELPGLSNHRIGEAFISGGIRDCGTGPEIVTADAGWTRVMATRLKAGRLHARALPQRPDAAGFATALACTE